MSYKKNSVHKVWNFVCSRTDDNFYFLDTQKNLCLFENENIKILTNDIKCEVAKPWRQGFIINETLFYDDDKLYHLFGQNIYEVITIDQNKLLVKQLDFINESIKYGFYNHTNANVEWLDYPNLFPRIVQNDVEVISVSENEIFKTTPNKEVVWGHSFSELIKSRGAFLFDELIEVENKLFFSIAGGEEGGLFCLESLSGKILKKFPGLTRPIFQDNNHIITSKSENVLCRINIENLDLEEWDVDHIVKSNKLESIHDHRSAAKDGLFYFTQSIGSDKAKLGVLDWENKQLVYNYDFEPDNGAVGSIQITDTMIFVNTQDQTLHIFEREV